MHLWLYGIKLSRQKNIKQCHHIQTFINGFEENWNNHIRRQRRQIINGLMEKWRGVWNKWERCIWAHTITKMPSLRVGSVSSFLNVSSPLVSLPNTAYWNSLSISLESIYLILIRNLSHVKHLAIKVWSITKKDREGWGGTVWIRVPYIRRKNNYNCLDKYKCSESTPSKFHISPTK
jgi:hypothetical protein